MKAYWQVGCACLLLVGGSALAAELGGAAAATTRPAGVAETQPGKELIRGEYAMMVNVLKLTEDQQQQLAKLLKARQDALEAWEQAYGKKFEELERTAKEQPQDSPAAQQAREELRQLRDDRDRVGREQRGAIPSILTDEQRAKWGEFRLYRVVNRRYSFLNLPEEAENKIMALCEQATKELQGVEDRDVRRKVMDKLHQDIQTQVLTEQQRQQVQERQAERRRAETQEGPTTRPARQRPGD
jgi:Spy/CpxP family protein refolding chaperone